MTVPYRYIRGAAAGRDETCVLCGSRRTDLVVDHCHPHGYARGLLCASCNARLALLDAGTAAPTPKEAFYLGNCPECRKAESPDSPHAFALRIGAVALAVATALDLSSRQAAVLALSLAETELSGDGRKALERESGGERREQLSPKPPGGRGAKKQSEVEAVLARLVETSDPKSYPPFRSDGRLRVDPDHGLRPARHRPAAVRRRAGPEVRADCLIALPAEPRDA